MKRILYTLRTVLPLFCLIFLAPDADAQLLKNLGKRAEKAAERAVERRVEQETTKKTDEVLDSILEPGKKGKSPTDKKGNPIPSPKEPNDDNEGTDVDGGNTSKTSTESTPKSISVYSKFDFVAGDQILFFDDFATDFIGDFPSKWDTNGTGEVVSLDGASEKWFEIKSGSTYFPNISDLSEDYTIEFDLVTKGIDRKTSSQAFLNINLEENNSYDYYRAGKNGVNVKIPFCQFIAANISVWNKIDGETIINNRVETDIRAEILETPHVSIAVNGQRFRLWFNEVKYLDIPKLVAPGNVLNYLRLEPAGLEDGKDRIFIKNLKIAAGGIDLRRKLISEGSVSTNGILFDSGSANIQPQSMGIILQISQVLQQEQGMKLKIVGHTDADGDDTTNLTLSKNRAEAVKNALVSVYNVSSDRLSTEGKGESQPVGNNGTADGKAQNRRVEFIKI